MKSIQIALLTAGALLALVGGAETASWGLAPLTASLNAKAPQIVLSDAGPFDDSTPVVEPTNGESSVASATLDMRPAIYNVPPVPTLEGAGPGPRPDSDVGTSAPAVTELASVTAPSPEGHEVEPTSDSSTSGSVSPVLDDARLADARLESTAAGDEMANSTADNAGPD